MHPRSPFLVELWWRTLARCAGLCLLLPLVVVAIEQTSASAAPLGASLARWLLELAPLAVALAVVDTVAEVESRGEALGAASLGLGRARWRAVVVAAAALVLLAVAAARVTSAAPHPEQVRAASPGTRSLAEVPLCPLTEAAPGRETGRVPPRREPVDPGVQRVARLQRALEPALGLVIALSALALAPRAARRAGLGEAVGRGRALGLVMALLVAALVFAAWRVALAVLAASLAA